ncbi:CHAT domain-containing protein [Nonomuraea sp. NPDC051941]|uniref:CHAT domain-containing protein n=1 Tax=Nonomuraea sp. NPDC051941 TaxID=3364373 RepID=UPI0037CBE465
MVFVCASVAVGMLGDLVVAGLPRWLALVGVAWAVFLGLLATRERLRQGGVWRLPPMLTAVPLAFACWAGQESLMAWAATPWIVALAVAATVRGLAEIVIAVAVVGAFFAPDATIFTWYAVPALAGALAEGLVLRLVSELLREGARTATRGGSARRARLLAVLPLPIALLQRGAERAPVVHFVGATFALTHKPHAALRWDRWAMRLYRRRGMVARELGALSDLATNLHSAGRHDEGLATVEHAQQVVSERLPAFLKRENPGVGPLGEQVLAARAEYDAVHLLLIEGRIRRDIGDISGACAVADSGLAKLDGDNGLRSHCESWTTGVLARSAVVSAQDKGLAAVLRGVVIGELTDFLMFKANLAGTLLHDDESALGLLDRARQVAAAAKDRGREFMATYNYATSLVRLRRYGEAETTLRSALEPAEGADVGARLMALGGMANLYRLQDRLDEAEPWYRKALDLAAQSHASMGINAGLGLALIRLSRGEVEAARRELGTLVARAEQLNSDAFLRASYLAAGKAYEQDGSREDLQRACGYYRSAIERLERGRASFDSEEERLRFLGGEARVEVYERMVATCVTLGKPVDAFDFAERGKARALAERLGGEDEEPLAWPAFQAVLATAGTPLLFVEYFTTVDGVLVIGARADWDRPRAVRVPLDRAGLRRFTLTNFGSAGRVREMVLGGLEELWHGHDPLVSPIAQWSSPDEPVVLAPHGLLHYLPLHALRLDDRYLIERNPVSYTASASVLRASRAAAARQTVPGGSPYAVFGDPTGDLPHARSEAEAVAALLDTTPVLGARVTCAAIMDAFQGADIAHYAGHARFDAADPLASGLCLGDGTVLTAREVATMVRGPRLATLSGCETGVSGHHPGDDVQGLVRGFLSAGTSTVLASLWRVPDDSAGYLMTRFYENLHSAAVPTKAEALRRAIVETRDHDHRWKLLHHWAPFTLLGDWD